MRYIEKAEGQPDCVRDFLDFFAEKTKDDPSSLSATYYDFRNPYKDDFLKLLIREQGGLCAYTGVGIDERLPAQLHGRPLAQWYKPHIEHLKPQSLCDPLEDLDYHNMVAALEVGGTNKEHFGAVAKANALLPVLPTQPACESRFSVDVDGNIYGHDVEAEQAIAILRLDHPTLTGWRRGAIRGYTHDADGRKRTNEELQANLPRMNWLENDRLKVFCFAIASAIRNELGIA